jgi:putative FmdB family regulatory protein
VPTYEYECTRCPRVFEVRQRISEPALETCDRCGGPVRRLLAPTPFILKGGGWYVTDYPSEARKKALQSESSTSKSTPAETKSSTGTETSPSSGTSSESPKSSTAS